MSEPSSVSLLSRSVTPAALAKWRDAVHAAVQQIERVRLDLAAQNPQGVNTSEDDALTETRDSLRQVSAGLHAVAPSEETTSRGDIDFFQLDTPDTRELLILLEQAQIVAERIDAVRGRALPESISLGFGESRGTDLAEAISEITIRVLGEVYGTQGSGQE